MPVEGPQKPNLAKLTREFVDGAILGADGRDSVARTAGDVVASFVPVVGDMKALASVYEGVSNKNTLQVVTGLLGLVPIAGDAAKVATTGVQKAAGVATREVAEKGLTAASYAASRAAAAGAKDGLRRMANDPRTRAEIAEAGERAFARTMTLLQDRLRVMAEEGRSPSVVTRDHDSYLDARSAAFSELKGPPNASWQDVRGEGRDDRNEVVVKQLLEPVPGRSGELRSRLGFRCVGPEAEQDRGQLVWWDAKDEEALRFGVESFLASPAEMDLIRKKYQKQR